MVSRGQPDRPGGDGATLLLDPAARGGRKLRPRHPGREARHRGRGRALRRGRAEERGRRRGPEPGLPAQHRRPRRCRAGPPAPLRGRRGRAAPLCRGPQRPRRLGRPPGLLRARRAGAGRSGRAGRPVERRTFLRAGAGAMSLAERLREALERGRGLSPVLLAGDALDEADGEVTPAAVLVAVVERREPTVILTERPRTMRKHPGQISFPGGRIEPEDDGPVGAALREAEEEIGLPPASVEVIGIADTYRTITGFEVTPVVGVVPPD